MFICLILMSPFCSSRDSYSINVSAKLGSYSVANTNFNINYIICLMKKISSKFFPNILCLF